MQFTREIVTARNGENTQSALVRAKHLEDEQMQRLDAASRRRDRNANVVFGFLAAAGVFLGVVQVWKQIDPGVQQVQIVTLEPPIERISTPTPEPVVTPELPR